MAGHAGARAGEGDDRGPWLSGAKELAADGAGLLAIAAVERRLAATAAVNERDGVAKRFEDAPRFGGVTRTECRQVAGVEEGDVRHSPTLACEWLPRQEHPADLRCTRLRR